MLRVGLTGGVACGKSTVARMFAERGAHLIRADEIAHELMRPGQRVYDAVVERFGREILAPDGSIDRARLAEAAFGGGSIEELNRLVHPAVINRQEAWMTEVAQRDPFGVAIVEAALILEAGVGKRFDKLVVVICSPEQKIERYLERVGGDREAARREVERRSAAQLPEADKVKAADFVVDNSGTLEETARQVEHIYAELKQAAAHRGG